ncbi:MAG: hypothetical protein GXN99_02890 [Candidatus Nanohaloarchaeota archaeon]|nr:hypothetical protein [Candidatus Nanohaloarchaeota archaeon]
MPENMIGYDFNPTTLPGKFNQLYLSFTINAAHAAARVMRLNESIWITPAYQKYYNLIIHQKEQLETKIKQALVSISQSISDLELLEHDLRKYEEYEHYLNDYKSNDEKKKRVAERFLKMIFVEQVDYHVGSTGQGPGRFSMAFLRNNNIMPTIVDDFLEIHSLEDIEKLKGKISGAERHVLLTKYKAFEEWLRMFETAVRTRLERLRLLKRSREKSLEEFRRWARPLIQKLKALEEALENKGGAKDYFSHTKLHNVMGFMRQTMHVWMFKNMLQPYEHAADQKSISHYEFGDKDPYNSLNPWNLWNRQNLVYNYDYGLIADHPWISYEWADKQAHSIFGSFLKKHKYSIYYLFLLTFIKTDYMQITQGGEIEDIDFVFYPSLLSHNLVLAKIMEYEAFMKELDDYTDEFLGIVEKMKGRAVVGYIKKGSSYYLAENFVEKWYFNSKTPLWYPDQYERMKTEIEKRLKGRSNSAQSISNIKFSKKELKDIFSDDLFYLSYHPRENKFLSYIEDNILGFTLWVRKYPPYETNFRDTITRVYYKHLAAEFSKLYKPLESGVILP